MKKLKYVLLLIILLFGAQASALRVSHYEPTFEMDEEFQGDQIIMYFGYRGESCNNSSFYIEFDSKYIDYVKTVAGDSFGVKENQMKQVGNKKVYKFDFWTNDPSDEIIYGAVVFKVNKDFSVRKTTELKVYDIISSNSVDGNKYRSEGYYIQLKRDSVNSILALRTDINEDTKREKFIYSIMPYIIIGIITVFLIVVAILMIPAKATEDRKRKVNAQLDPLNYPIPGVGPFPSVKKKSKRDIIEPEEKTIMPLSEFVAKSDDVNQELMNQGLEVDNNMFKDNPTKEGEQGLININPLAFDDGEEDVLDTTSSRDNNNDNDIDTL